MKSGKWIILKEALLGILAEFGFAAAILVAGFFLGTITLLFRR